MLPLEKYVEAGMAKTKFRCLRRFRDTEGVDRVEGEIIGLTDDQVIALIWMPGTIEPVAEADRCRVVPACPGVTWELPKDDGCPASQPWVIPRENEGYSRYLH